VGDYGEIGIGSLGYFRLQFEADFFLFFHGVLMFGNWLWKPAWADAVLQVSYAKIRKKEKVFTIFVIFERSLRTR
jgi:hypothetical protein